MRENQIFITVNVSGKNYGHIKYRNSHLIQNSYKFLNIKLIEIDAVITVDNSTHLTSYTNLILSLIPLIITFIYLVFALFTVPQLIIHFEQKKGGC